MRVYVVYQYIKEVQTPDGIQPLGGMAAEELNDADAIQLESVIELGKEIQKRRNFSSLTILNVIPLPLKAESSILVPSGILR